MVFRKTIALSFAAMLASASAAMAATTHHPHGMAAQPRADRADNARASYAAEARRHDQAGPYYYGADDNGSVWAFYPGYVPTARN
jgi:hypothetical protein